MKIKGIKVDIVKKEIKEIEEEISDEEYEKQLEEAKQREEEILIEEYIAKEKENIIRTQAIQNLKEKGILIEKDGKLHIKKGVENEKKK